MGRSGYTEDCEHVELYRGAVLQAMKGKRGQQFFRDLIAALDAMPEKKLITKNLENEHGVCALGSLGRQRGVDMSGIDTWDHEDLGKLFGIARTLAAETMFVNDDDFRYYQNETPEQRWTRMRQWAVDCLAASNKV